MSPRSASECDSLTEVNGELWREDQFPLESLVEN